MQQRHRRAPPHEAADQPKKKNPSIVCSSWLGKSAPKARSFPPNVSPAAPTDIRKLRPLVSLPRAGGGGNCCCCTAPLALWACGSADARVTRAHHCGGIGLGHLPHDRDTHHAGRMITTSMYKYIYITNRRWNQTTVHGHRHASMHFFTPMESTSTPTDGFDSRGRAVVLWPCLRFPLPLPATHRIGRRGPCLYPLVY